VAHPYTESSLATRHVILAVDLGGTKLATGLVDTTPAVLRRTVAASVTTSQDACLRDLLARLDEEVRRASGAIEAIGVGTASVVDFRRGSIVMSTNLPLADHPLRDVLHERYDLPAVIDNDATVACIGEHQWGAGRGVDEMLMLTIGTGIGGGIISGGKPYRGLTGAGGELGHMVIDVNGPPCQGNCPNHGCLESLVSGTAIGKAARAAAEQQPESALGRALAAGETIDSRLLHRLAAAGDPGARAVYDRIGTYLGVGITNLANIFNPELIVVGGGAAAAGGLLLEPARRVLSARGLRPQRDQVRIEQAQFGDDAGLIGAAALAATELFVTA
jgi:glucokinase